ncbi:ZIP family metal transporter [Leptolyngbya sp. FACHB-261]|uniref:ZIP family metal transporter n=1 Tax=Leptolyngbya sp. FACHB-261 TaxID=2692806 RepID=UPI0016873ECE|nr:ZIP family metal transporter [Leptolyngbya sp. FACHB-261]MBD2103670.1 ZIP family metal transporter [Leptolyngbya sp. FACHB-261]
MGTLQLGLLASLLAGMATGVGALPIFFIRDVTQKAQDIMLGFGAGVMLAATAFSLIIPGIEAASGITGSKVSAAFIVAAGLLLGGIFLWLSNKYSPHEHFIKGPEGSSSANLRRIWLFIIAITLHNLPEGLAVGVGFGGGDSANGLALAVGIGLQNMPEGLVVALGLLAAKYSKQTAFLIALATGMVEPIGGLLGAGAVSVAEPILPWALAFAAGAMLFVISDEIIPETHRKGFETESTAGLMVGFVVMMILDVTLG